MMFGFGKPKSRADKALAVMDDAIQFASEKWAYFQTRLAFKDGVSLEEQITMFSIPLSEGLQKNFAPLKGMPDGILLLIVAQGVMRSGTHTKAQIEAALGVPLPG